MISTRLYDKRACSLPARSPTYHLPVMVAQAEDHAPSGATLFCRPQPTCRCPTAAPHLPSPYHHLPRPACLLPHTPALPAPTPHPTPPPPHRVTWQTPPPHPTMALVVTVDCY